MRCARLTWLQSCLTWLSVCVCKHFAKVPGALRNPAANTQEHQGRGMYQRLNYSSIEKHSWPHLNMAGARGWHMLCEEGMVSVAGARDPVGSKNTCGFAL